MTGTVQLIFYVLFSLIWILFQFFIYIIMRNLYELYTIFIIMRKIKHSSWSQVNSVLKMLQENNPPALLLNTKYLVFYTVLWRHSIGWVSSRGHLPPYLHYVLVHTELIAVSPTPEHSSHFSETCTVTSFGKSPLSYIHHPRVFFIS